MWQRLLGGLVAQASYKAGEKLGQKIVERRMAKQGGAAAPADTPNMHGSARWAYASELQKLFDTEYHWVNVDESISLGQLGVALSDCELPTKNPHMEWVGEGHLLTVAPTRSGKGAAQIVPTLIRYPGSVVVMDPKGENWDLTANTRKALGGHVYRLAPFRDGTDCLNPLDFIKDSSEARVAAEMICPRNPDSKGGAVFFEDEAINFLAGVLMFFALDAEGENRTIGAVRDAINLSSAEEFEGMCKAMSQHQNRMVAGAGSAMLKKDKGGIREVMASLNSKMAIWDDDGLRAATRATNIPVDDFKRCGGDDHEPHALYVDVPFSKMKAYSGFLRLVFSLVIDTLQADNEKGTFPVLFLLDEFPAMGEMPQIVENLSYMAGYGVRLWLFVQKLPQLMDAYPRSWRGILDDTEAKFFMDTREPETLKMLSDWMGQTTIAYETASTSVSSSSSLMQMGTEGQSQNSGTAYTGRPLVTPDELQDLLCQQYDNQAIGRFQLNMISGYRPFATYRPYYFLNTNLVEVMEKHNGR